MQVKFFSLKFMFYLRFFPLTVRRKPCHFNDWQIAVRTVYYRSIVAYNYDQRLSVSEGLPFKVYPCEPTEFTHCYYTYLVSIE